MNNMKLVCLSVSLMVVWFWSGVSSVQAFTLDPTGMAKPIADLRDYDGTYDGSIGTGTRGFVGGTLYRDNQDGGKTSGCLGEGCGRHPGVDIPVPSGTSIYAALDGTVVVNRCDATWGGLIVIRSLSPYRNGEYVYFVYAHLRSRLPGLGSFVFTGNRIGYSGGNPKTDGCAGRSTGSHLHFQIDKEDGNPEPYFPSLSSLNQRDDSFSVSERTYNPIVFVTGGYRWTFAQSGNRELWDLFNLQSWGVGNGALWMDGAFDPYIKRGGNTLTNCGKSRLCSSNVAAEADIYQDVFLDLYNGCYDGQGKIYFTTSRDPNWNENKTVLYSSRRGSQSTHVWMGYNPNWKGIITGLRIDPAEQCSGNFDPTYYGEITIER